MEWKIANHSDGTVTALYGNEIEMQENLAGIGYIMGGFMDYYSSRFNNEKEARAYIKKHPNPLK